MMKKLITLVFAFCLPFLLFSQSETKKPDGSEMIKVKTLKDILTEEEGKKNSGKTTPSKTTTVKKQEEKKQPVKQVQKTQKTEEVKKKKIIPFENPKEAFNGKLSSFDIFLEKQKSYYYLWIRKKGSIESVALVSYDKVGKSWRKYYLRSNKLIPSQAENQIRYKTTLLGNRLNLFFLASSKVQTHPVLGPAYRIIIPKKTIYGYKRKKSKHSIYGEVFMKEGKSKFIIKTFSEKHAQGKASENLYTLTAMNESKSSAFALRLLGKKTGSKQVIYKMRFASPYLNLLSVKLQNKSKEFTLLESPSRPYGGLRASNYHKNMNLLYWYYSFDKNCFIVRFDLTLPKTNIKNLHLKIETHSGSIKYPLR